MDSFTLADMGNTIRQARERKGWSQVELAEALGLKQQSVSRWEAGESKPRSATLAAVTAALDFTESELEVLRSLYYPVGGPGPVHESPSVPAQAGDDIELDFNSAMRHVPDEVRQAVIRIVEPYLDEGDRT